MTLDEFNKEIEKVERFYEKDIPEEQKKYWYKEVKLMNVKRFQAIIGQIFRTSKFLPKLADIVEINTNMGYSTTETSKKTKCTKCKGTGYIIYNKIKNEGENAREYQYMAVCDCGLKKRYEGWKISDERHRNNYYIPLASEMGLYM
jgi:hypothetical protein